MGLTNKKVLITSGPTWVAIDRMRVISNISTGSLARLIAGNLTEFKAKVTVLEGPVTEQLNTDGVRVLKFYFYDELRSLLKKELRKKYDIVIHAAAVSDYRLKHPFKGKIFSGIETLTLELCPTEKIIDSIKKIAPKVFLVGFKLEPNMGKASAIQEASGLIRHAGCDLVVANSIDKNNRYSGHIIDHNGKVLAYKKSRRTMSKALVEVLGNKV